MRQILDSRKNISTSTDIQQLHTKGVHCRPNFLLIRVKLKVFHGKELKVNHDLLTQYIVIIDAS